MSLNPSPSIAKQFFKSFTYTIHRKKYIKGKENPKLKKHNIDEKLIYGLVEMLNSVEEGDVKLGMTILNKCNVDQNYSLVFEKLIQGGKWKEIKNHRKIVRIIFPK